MYKSTCKAESYRGRIADYSTTGFARGIFAQLPPITKRIAVERAEFRDMIETLHKESKRLGWRLQRNCNDEEKKRFTESKCVIDGRIGHLEKFLKTIKSKQYDAVFCFVSDLFLNQESLHALRAITRTIVNELQERARSLETFQEGDGI